MFDFTKRQLEIANKFSFGFEIEGLFNKPTMLLMRKFRGFDLHGDGSVHVDYPDEGEWFGYELVSPVYKGRKGLKKFERDLLIFELNKNYVRDDSCGIHLHIKTRDSFLDDTLRSMLFIEKLQDFVEENLCPDTQERLWDCEWSRSYKSAENHYDNKCWRYARSEFESGEKYKFVRNHPQGTLEFRIFSTCKHRN